MNPAPTTIPTGIRDWHAKVASPTGTTTDRTGRVLYTWDLVLVDTDETGTPDAAEHIVAAASIHPGGYRTNSTVHGSITQPYGTARPRFRRARRDR